MRTSGRRIRKGERARATCDYCGARFDLRDLTRDASGLLRCPQEGNGRDAVTLNEANVAAAEAWADRKMPEPYDPGQYDKETAVAIGRRTGNLLAEDGSPLTTEDGIYILLDQLAATEITLEFLLSQDGFYLTAESGTYLLLG